MRTRTKRLLLLSLAVLVTGVILIAAYIFLYQYFRKQVIQIAIVAPLSGPNQVSGQDMRKGIKLYLDTLRREKRLTDKRIKLLMFDDADDPNTAAEVAEQIVTETNALVILGHFSDPTSLTAGRWYKKHRIPAITASAVTEELTLDNDWYFRIALNSRFQAVFLANYVRHVLSKQAVSIVSSSSIYSRSLAKNFQEMAQTIGLTIRLNEQIDLEQEERVRTQQYRSIVSRLSASPDPGIIFIALHHPEAIELITALQAPEKRYTIIGPDTFSTKTMTAALAQMTQAHQQPRGYYSDGIYALAPFMIDTANHQAQLFKERYEALYPDEHISWVSASYYDAMAVVAKAIEHSELEGDGHIRGDRQKIREALIRFYDKKTAVKGITGDIYFDQYRNVGHPPVVGFYHKQHLLPNSTQYQAGSSDDDNPFDDVLTGELMVIDQHHMVQTQVTYTGIHINRLNHLDLKNPRYTVDFYLWFRFREEFSDNEIVFANALIPITLNQPVAEEVTSDGLTTRVYHVTGDFTKKFNFHAYPFDAQVLPIAFRHANLTRDHLIYVSDAFEPPQFIKEHAGELVTDQTALKGWKVSRVWPTQDVISHRSTLGNPDFFEEEHTINYSQYALNIRIRRVDVSFFVRAFLPVLVLLGLVGAIYMLVSVDRLRIRLSALSVFLLMTALYHILFLLDLPEEYLIPIDYAYFGLYALLLVSIFLSVSGYIFYRKRLALLQGIGIFHSFSDKMKSDLCKRMRRYRYKKPDHTVIHQGDDGDSLFLIVQGEARAWVELEDGTQLEVNYLKTGDFFGEMALLTGEKRSAYVTTTTPAFLGEVTRADIAPFLARQPEIVTEMSAELTRRKLRENQRLDSYEDYQIDHQEISDQYSSSIKRFFELH